MATDQYVNMHEMQLHACHAVYGCNHFAKKITFVKQQLYIRLNILPLAGKHFTIMRDCKCTSSVAMTLHELYYVNSELKGLSHA